MSNTEFIISPAFNKLNSNQVLENFQVPPHDHAVRAAMNYMFRTYKDELPKNVTFTKRSETAAELTIEAIYYRYELFKDFIEDYFKGAKIDRDALAVAAICNEYTTHINEPCQDTEGNIKLQYDGIDADLAERAIILWEDSVNLESKAIPPYEVLSEAVFLAHIIAMEVFAKGEAKIEDDYDGEYEDDILAKIVNEDIPAIRAFIRHDTDIGRQLENMITYFEQQFKDWGQEAETPQPLPPVRQKPQLRLVPKSPCD